METNILHPKKSRKNTTKNTSFPPGVFSSTHQPTKNQNEKQNKADLPGDSK